MKKIAVLSLIGFLWIVFYTSTALAAKNDLTLWRFCIRDPNNPTQCQAESGNTTRVMADNAKFKKWAGQFAALMGPRYHAPPETLGSAGWDLGFEFTLNQIPGGDGWDDALEGVDRLSSEPGKSKSAPSMLNTVQVHVRKGLPFSTELGVSMIYLLNSEMYMMGAEGKFSFFEGFTYVPEFAVRMNYSHLFGSPDIDMDVYAWDLSIGKGFGLGGFIEIAPYTGYSLEMAIVAPKVLNPTFDKINNGRLLMLEKPDPLLIHRWFLGVRFLTTHIHFSPEVYVTSEQVYNYSFHLGADF